MTGHKVVPKVCVHNTISQNLAVRCPSAYPSNGEVKKIPTTLSVFGDTVKTFKLNEYLALARWELLSGNSK